MWHRRASDARGGGGLAGGGGVGGGGAGLSDALWTAAGGPPGRLGQVQIPASHHSVAAELHAARPAKPDSDCPVAMRGADADRPHTPILHLALFSLGSGPAGPPRVRDSARGVPGRGRLARGCNCSPQHAIAHTKQLHCTSPRAALARRIKSSHKALRRRYRPRRRSARPGPAAVVPGGPCPYVALHSP
jgi:hypothetical protein